MSGASAAGPPGVDEARVSLRRLVAGFDARSEREIASRRRFLAELDRLERPFDRHADPVHVTASGVVLGARGTVLLLHKRMRRWLPPGGHVEPGEHPESAALREAHEETGLVVRHPAGGARLVHLDVHPVGDHVHLDLCYLLLAPDRDPAPGPEESQEVRWFSLEEAASLTDESAVAALARATAAPAG